MRRPQALIYESDGQIAAQVRRLAAENSWLVREPRHLDSCLALLDDGQPAILFVKLERDPLEGMTLLAQVTERAPDCPVVVVSDVKMESAEQRLHLSALAFDLGARYVLFPPVHHPVLEDLVSGLLDAAIKRLRGTTDDRDDYARTTSP